jgi:flagellar biosynthesis/type III secretory pathway protein FliH
MPSKLYFAYRQALEKGNEVLREEVVKAIVEEMAGVEKDFITELQALKNEPTQKEGLFD